MVRLAENDLPSSDFHIQQLLPPSKVETVTPSDSDELAHVCRKLRCSGSGSGGDLAIVMLDGSTCTITLGDNEEFVGFVKQVMQTNTTAGGSGSILAFR